MKKLIPILVLAIAAWLAIPALASRNSSGTYSLPATWNPVVSGTPITKEWANGTLNDMATEITSSLDRSGRGAMLAPLRTPSGTSAAPAHSFSTEPSSGLYLDTTNQVCLSVLSSPRQRWTPTMTTIYTPATMADTVDFTNVARFNHANGASITVGDLWLSAATTQGVIKQNGQLSVGTAGAYALNLATGGATRLAFDGTSGDATLATNLTLTSGDLNLNGAAAQGLYKSSQRLNIGTTDGNGLYLRTNGVDRFDLTGTGDLHSNGTARITNLPDPVSNLDVSNKQYVDNLVTTTFARSTVASTALAAYSSWTNLATSPIQVPANGAMVYDCLVHALPTASGSSVSGIYVGLSVGANWRLATMAGEGIRSTSGTNGNLTTIAQVNVYGNTVLSINPTTSGALDFAGPPRFFFHLTGTLYNGTTAQALNLRVSRDSSTPVNASADCTWRVISP